MCIGFLFLLFLSATSTHQMPTSEPGSGITIEVEEPSTPQIPNTEENLAIVVQPEIVYNEYDYGILLGVIEDDVFEAGCGYEDLLKNLSLSKNTEMYVISRPVKNHTNPVKVHLDVTLYAILDVAEKEQRFISYIWVEMRWQNKHINWNPKDFCGMQRISVPTEILWKPDITISEMIEKDKAPPSPYIAVYHNGEVYVKNDQVVLSTCNMQIYNFPFDIQICNLTFSSVIHNAKELQLRPLFRSSLTTEFSRHVMKTQDEWIFINITVIPINSSHSWERDKIIYMITMKRRPVLYVVNFLLPVLFFLCLDLASFFISDTAGEKLGFKVTVLLAVTVLQLILNEILPSTSNRIPLIVTFCVVIFALMLLSLLETILVVHLIAKDSAPQENEADTDRSLSEDRGKSPNCDTGKNKWTCCTCLRNPSGRDTSPKLLSTDKEGSCSKLTGESHSLEMISEELRELQKSLTVILSSKDEEVKPGYWTRVAKRINRAFFIFYVITVCLFLVGIFVKWNVTYQMYHPREAQDLFD